MKSIAFPKMFNTNSTNIVKDLDATKQNILSLLRTEKGELFGDPYYGIRLKKYMYEQNNLILKDILIDEIYTQLAIFMPQLIISRKDIKLTADRAKIYVTFEAKNRANYQTDMYSIQLYNEDDQK